VIFLQNFLPLVIDSFRMQFDFNIKNGLALLVDPDEGNVGTWSALAERIQKSTIDVVLVGGSFLYRQNLHACLTALQSAKKPLIIFPGSNAQIDSAADGILLLSLISGRNPDLLIGQHVQSAISLKMSGLSIYPTGYVLIDGGKPTTVSYISNTQPIPKDKPGLAAATALAGEQLGMKIIYLDAGSGADESVSAEMIQQTKALISVPIIVGGGIKSTESIQTAWNAGANIVVIGNHAFEHSKFMEQLLAIKKQTIFN
jgi:phosphoglycerol geranylgeranyltransferase